MWSYFSGTNPHNTTNSIARLCLSISLDFHTSYHKYLPTLYILVWNVTDTVIAEDTKEEIYLTTEDKISEMGQSDK